MIKSELRGAWIIAAVVLVGYGYFFHFHERAPNPNETSRLYLTLAVVEDGALSIDGPIRRNGIVHDRSVYKGRSYCDKAPGLSFLAVPFYGLVKGIASLFRQQVPLWAAHLSARWGAVILPTAAFCAFLFLFLAPLLPDPRLRALLVLVYAFGSLARTYGVLFFGHQSAAVLSAGGMMLLYRCARAPRWRGAAGVIGAGLLLGAAFATEYPAFISVFIAGALALWRVRPWWRIGLLALGVAVPVALALWYNQAAFGNPFSPGYSHLTSSFAAVHAKGVFGVTTPHVDALWGLTFSLERGLFVYSPWLLAAFPGFYFLARARENRALLWVCAGAFVGYFYFATSFNYWIGGDAAGPRHLTVLVPFLIFPIAALMERLAKTSWESPRILFTSLCVFSILLVGLVSATFSYFSPLLLNPYRDLSLELWREGAFPPGLGSALGLRGFASAVPYLVVVAALAFGSGWAWPGAGRARRALRVLYPVALAAMALALLLAASPQGRTPWASHEVYRYLRIFTPEPPRYSEAGKNTREGLILRGNNTVLLRQPAKARHLYLQALRRP